MDKDWIKKQESELIKAKLPLSAHTIEGWRHQYHVMKRFYERAVNASNPEDELDFFITYFQNCFHLKDWIIEWHKDDGIDWSSKIHSFINSTRPLRICRDVCNGLKHLRISKPSVDSNLAFFYEYRPHHKIDNTKENGWSLFIDENDTKQPERIYLETLAADCLNSWNQFITSEPNLR